jgi:hypothetical protein
MKSETVSIAEKTREFDEANLRAARYYMTLDAEEYPALHDFARRVFARLPVQQHGQQRNGRDRRPDQHCSKGQ